jgi:hypothetical protein
VKLQKVTNARNESQNKDFLLLSLPLSKLEVIVIPYFLFFETLFRIKSLHLSTLLLFFAAQLLYLLIPYPAFFALPLLLQMLIEEFNQINSNLRQRHKMMSEENHKE